MRACNRCSLPHPSPLTPHLSPLTPHPTQVYTGFRLAPGGAQQVYGIKADLVCYGKTLGGGLPVGVLCGKKDCMTRADPKKVSRVAYVIGTFAGHPAVMGSMNAFLTWLNKARARG